MQIASKVIAASAFQSAVATRVVCVVGLTLLLTDLSPTSIQADETPTNNITTASEEQNSASSESSLGKDDREAHYLAGSIGVGTWNTIADFRRFQYQSGNQTLHLSSALNAWSFSSGQWKVVNGGLRCDQSAAPALARIGTAKDRFTITLRARKLGGKEGFLIAVGSVPGGEQSWLNLGGFGNTKHVLQMPVVDKSEIAGSIQPQRWYDIKIDIVGKQVQCFLDGERILEATTTSIIDPTEQFGLGAWETQVEYDAIEILADGKTFYRSEFPADHHGWIRVGAPKAVSSLGDNEPNRKRKANSTIRDKTLRLTEIAQPAFALLGRNTTFSFQAKKTGGQEGFLVLLGTGINGEKAWWNIGGFGNSRHVLELPGVGQLVAPGRIEQGKWYDVRVERSGSDIRCYLDDQLIHDTSRMIDQTERQLRFEQLLAADGASLMLPAELEQFSALSKRSVYIGKSAQQTFQTIPSMATFTSLSPTMQRDLIRTINRHRLTWEKGWGFEAELDDRQRSILQAIDEAVSLYNSLGVFDKHVRANNSPGTPTADANFEGSIRFGKSFNSRVALHELGHCMGVGTHPRWGRVLVQGSWTGPIANDLVKQFDGPEATLKGDRMHMWPYGLNFDNEDGVDARRRHVSMVAAVRRDMGFHSAQWIHYTTELPEGKYWLAPRSDLKLLLTSNRQGAGKSERVLVTEGTRSKLQQFFISRQENGTYFIQTVAARPEKMGVAGDRPTTESLVSIMPDTRQTNDGWYIVPLGDGYYKISPRSNLELGLTAKAEESQHGAIVGLSIFADSFSQQWQLVPITNP